MKHRPEQARSRAPGHAAARRDRASDRAPTRTAAATAATAIQRLAAGRTHGQSKIQQRFARLIKQVDQRKQRLRAWYDAQPAIHREIAAYHAERERYRRTAHDLVCLFDRLHGHAIFNKTERAQLRDTICSLAGDLLGEPGCEDLKPIYNRHANSDFDAEAEAEADDQLQAQMMRMMMEEALGVDFGDADVSSTEKLHAFAAEQAEKMEQARAEAQARRAPRKKSARQLAKDAEREAETARTGKVLQEVYRRLAVALHPDLEQDPAERARKTELMQQVNVAYEAKDLLRLLELQLTLEQIDPDHASEVAEDRLRRYNTILDQQVKELDGELVAAEMPWRMELDVPPPARLVPAQVIGRIRADLDEVTREHAGMQRDLEAFQDPARLKAQLRAMRPRRAHAQRDLFG